MEITEVRIKLMDEPGERLKAFCSITFDDSFVVRELKIIEGTSGPFVAMPSRKLTAHCHSCGIKNHLRSNFCNQCGKRLDSNRAIRQPDGRAKLYADIAHPINAGCREMIQEHVVREFQLEIERAKEPGYVSRYDDFDESPTESQRRSRVDASHGHAAASAPHHPPQGRSLDTPLPTPPSEPQHNRPDTSSQLAQNQPSSTLSSQGPASQTLEKKGESEGFGDGIFQEG